MTSRAVPPARPVSARCGARRRLVLAALLTAAGCRGNEEQAPEDAAPPPTRATAADTARAAAPGADTGCVLAGLWQECSIEKRLESAGMAPERLPDRVRQPGLSAAGTAYRLGSAELHVFLYPDAAAAGREATRFDAATAVRPKDNPGGLLPPQVVASSNLVAVLFARTDRQAERVQLALTAGLPPAAHP